MQAVYGIRVPLPNYPEDSSWAEDTPNTAHISPQSHISTIHLNLIFVSVNSD
jgi:hypothetical protein